MKELELAQRACIEAAEIACKYFRKDFEVRHKGRVDLVTQADIECESKIKEIISNEFPGHAFLAEEQGASGESDCTWVIDPIDGTTNFAHGVEQFCHSVALAKGNEIVCGAVYAPLQNRMFTAEKGKGAFLNNEKISVSKTGKLIDSLIITGFPYDNEEMAQKAMNGVSSLKAECQGVRRFGSAALDLCFVARGVCDGFFEYVLNPWDVAAGMLIVREAKGRVTDINGVEATMNSGHFLASNSLIHDELRGLLEAVE